MLNLAILLIFLQKDKSDLEYIKCIESKPCQHDGEVLTKLPKKQYEEVMQCRIKRHIECIKTEIEHEKSN